ncbi:MAG: response regulator, partial [Verrucomicrobia bacterium]|nr:response regulator [Verrucomicrobiota bacterium]
MKMQTLIVDDEALGRERLRLLLAKMPEFDIAGECHGGQEAVELIETLSPQIVLLDIQMPDLDGFGVIAELQRRGVQMPIIIFVTAYQEHAVKAFEVNAIDYLLKPVQGARLEAALDRARTQLAKDNPKDGQTRLANVVEQMQPKTTTY